MFRYFISYRPLTLFFARYPCCNTDNDALFGVFLPFPVANARQFGERVCFFYLGRHSSQHQIHDSPENVQEW